MGWFDDIIYDIVKQFRLTWQKNANEIINKAEDVIVKLAKEKYPEVPEAAIRKLWWKGWDYVKEQFDADWIKDT